MSSPVAAESPRPRPAPGPEPARIASVGMFTRERPAALRRGLSSYVENTLRHGRTLDFVVMDDAPRAGDRQVTREVLRALAAHYGVPLRYAGLEQKLIFARRLISSGLPPDLVKFALFDVEHYGYTLGANRNALALETAGAGSFEADDDTLCSFARPPQEAPGVAYVSERGLASAHPCQLWFYDHRDAALAAASADADLIGLHEEWLGRRLPPAPEAQGADTREAEAPFLARVRTGTCRVAITFSGVLGHCSWATPTPYLFVEGASFTRLTLSEARYRAAYSSREMLRVVTRVTLADRSTRTPGMFAGFDRRGLLPPQFPVGRGQDLLFFRTLAQCRPGAAFAHLPWALLHVPADGRRFAPRDMTRPRAGVEFYALLSALLDAFPGVGLEASEAEALKALGRFLEEWGERPVPELNDFLVVATLRETQTTIRHLESRLRAPQAPDFWARDVARFLDVVRGGLGARSGALVPIDLLRGGDKDQAWDLARRLLRRFGRLLCVWPDMLATAAALRQRGLGLARPLEERS